MTPRPPHATPPSGSPRRRFLGALAAIAAPALLPAAQAGADPAPASRRLPLAFSTLGCPEWSWDKVLREAARLGYAAIELRGLQGELDLPARPELRGARLRESRDRLAAQGLAVAALGASAELHEPEAGKRAAQLDEGRRFVDLAHALGAPYVRVFGDKLVAGEDRSATIDRIVAGLRELGAHARGSGVSVLLESHGDFVRSRELREILAAAARPEVALLWDTHHTFVFGEEAPDDTLRALGPLVRHVHFKDSRRDESGVRYVLTGEGSVPIRDTSRMLVARGYGGYYSFEWEKMWHPEIAAPEVAFPHYARVMGGYLAEAGVKA